jgi:hypothetical protein
MEQGELMEYRDGELEGQLKAIRMTNVVTKATDYVLILTIDDGSQVYCQAKGAVQEAGITLTDSRVMVKGWILQDLSAERTVYVAAESIEAAAEALDNQD